MITFSDYLQGRDKDYPLTLKQEDNTIDIVGRLFRLEKEWGEPLVLTSGYRPAPINAGIQEAKPHSTHITCQGVDLRDGDGAFSRWLISNVDLLEELGFWMEAPSSAKNHVHLQTVPPKSGNRIFIA